VPDNVYPPAVAPRLYGLGKAGRRRNPRQSQPGTVECPAQIALD
jgi:hypothetical protein